MKWFIALFAALLPVVPAVAYMARHRYSPEKLTRKTIMGLSALNLILGFGLLGIGLAWFLFPGAVHAAGLAQAVSKTDPVAYISAAVSVLGGVLGAAWAVGTVGAAAMGVIAERPELFGRALLFVGLAEGIGIYGVLIAFVILSK